MKIVNISILLCLSFASCGIYKRDNFVYTNNGKNTWINAYKYEAFYGCIQEGIGNDSLRIILAKKDLFSPNLDIDFVTLNQARALGKDIIKKMPAPYIKIDKGEEALLKKNYVSFSCLVYYASKDLDSAAKQAYKIYSKESLIKE